MPCESFGRGYSKTAPRNLCEASVSRTIGKCQLKFWITGAEVKASLLACQNAIDSFRSVTGLFLGPTDWSISGPASFKKSFISEGR